MEGVGGSVPEEKGGYAAVGSGAGFQEACSEEGSDEPGPEGLLFGGWVELGFGVGHGFCLPEGLRRFYIFILRRTAEKIMTFADLVYGLVECSRSTEERFSLRICLHAGSNPAAR